MHKQEEGLGQPASGEKEPVDSVSIEVNEVARSQVRLLEILANAVIKRLQCSEKHGKG